MSFHFHLMKTMKDNLRILLADFYMTNSTLKFKWTTKIFQKDCGRLLSFSYYLNLTLHLQRGLQHPSTYQRWKGNRIKSERNTIKCTRTIHSRTEHEALRRQECSMKSKIIWLETKWMNWQHAPQSQAFMNLGENKRNILRMNGYILEGIWRVCLK